MAVTFAVAAAAIGALVVSRTGDTRSGPSTAYRVALASPSGPACARSGGTDASWPPACWRPYARTSPFNRPIGRNAPTASFSRAAVDRLMSFGPPGPVVAGGSRSDDFDKPTYYAQASDPVFRVRCTRPWGRCETSGMRIHIPDAARPAGAGDAHMTVVAPDGRTEYDFWKVASKPRGGGTLTVAWGGRTSLLGNGLGSAAVAAGFGNLAGIVRAQELQAGRIDHALFMVVHCTNGRGVYPAASGNLDGACTDRRGAAPPLGARYQLDMSDAEIDALPVPAWKKVILRAMARYGMFVGDTTGASWGIQIESDDTYASFGKPPLFAEYARANGFVEVPASQPGKPPSWVGDLASGIDWRTRLRVVAPCVSRGRC